MVCKLAHSMALAHVMCVVTCPRAGISQARAAGASQLSSARCSHGVCECCMYAAQASARPKHSSDPRQCICPPARDNMTLFARRGWQKGMLQLVPWSLGVAALQAHLKGTDELRLQAGWSRNVASQLLPCVWRAARHRCVGGARVGTAVGRVWGLWIALSVLVPVLGYLSRIVDLRRYTYAHMRYTMVI